LEPVALEPVAPEPLALQPVALEPVAPEPVALEPVALEPVAPEPVAPEPVLLAEDAALATSEAELDTVAAAISAAEPAMAAAAPTIAIPEPDPVAPIVLELEHPIVEPEPDSNAVSAVAEPLVIEPTVTELEPAVAELSVEPLESLEPAASVAAAAPTPSVFSRRPPETAKVSFAGMAKDLLPQNHRPPQSEPPVSSPRASVEEITRAALDDLTGATDKRASDDRSTAFARPGGPFAKPTPKQPRTIAPPPSDGPPIAGGSKLVRAPKRVAPAEPATAPAEGETAQAVPDGFEGLQFPNDGVLTRQWMEFLNQMAAGK
jgi:nicotinate-nucleotide--dimethylbenzimidazole phosphoribosyltransferase